MLEESVTKKHLINKFSKGHFETILTRNYNRLVPLGDITASRENTDEVLTWNPKAMIRVFRSALAVYRPQATVHRYQQTQAMAKGGDEQAQQLTTD